MRCREGETSKCHESGIIDWSRGFEFLDKELQKVTRRDEVLSLYAFIDRVMTLPEPLEDDDHRAIQAIEEAEQMRYVTTAERIGMRKGMERGLERGLKQGLERGLESERALLQRQARRRFGDAVAERAAVLLALIRAPETLEQLGEALLDDTDGEVWLTAVQAQMEHSDDRMDAAGDASPRA
ncbi:DUF4351 domain-containing protein [Thiocapsa bogorovii]|uniref:DUF4351 domain-containing protein n=1 Tax=Thiocapsa bogorovii TaxID=521689 RepID=UPI001E388C7F|nr:DUF4351 domain-containing protein [Thiocapsa bogorovii]UHD16256.1 DUF4351 domain-containing protein [Thiocapsa bogorovii]